MDSLHHTPSFFSSGCSLILPRMHLTYGRFQIAVTTLKLVLHLTVSATFCILTVKCLFFYSECMQLSTGADMLTNRSCLHNIVCIMAGKPLVESYLAEPYFLCFQLPAKPSHSTTRIIGASSKKSPSVMKELKGSFMEASTR